MKRATTTLTLAVALVMTGACGDSASFVETGPTLPSSANAGGDSGAPSPGPAPPAPKPGAGDASPGGGSSEGGAPEGGTPEGGAGDGAAGDGGGPTPDAGGDGGSGPGPTLSNVRLDELQVAGTHNSYHVAPAVAFDASHKYTHKPLDQQLQGGVRALELDLHKGITGTFEIYHLPVIDQNVTCGTLDACLEVIERWSSAHPLHTPIFVWFEVKDDVGGLPISSLDPVDAAARRIFGESRIVTPAWLKGSHANVRERLATDGWPRLDEVRGKIMFVLLNDNDGHTDEYTHGYTSLDGRLMFARAAESRFGAPWAAVAKVGATDAAAIASARANHLLTAANVCSIDTSDAECTSRLATATSLGLHMMKDDLPFAITGRSYHLALPNGSPGCNPVSGSAACDPTRLE